MNVNVYQTYFKSVESYLTYKIYQVKLLWHGMSMSIVKCHNKSKYYTQQVNVNLNCQMSYQVKIL